MITTLSLVQSQHSSLGHIIEKKGRLMFLTLTERKKNGTVRKVCALLSSASQCAAWQIQRIGWFVS